MGQVTEAQYELDRENARNRVIGEARNGHDPRDIYSEEDLAWAFEGHEQQLAELSEVAEQAREEKARKQEQREQARAVRTLAARILEEWKRDEEVKLRRKAEAEARKRLGLS